MLRNLQRRIREVDNFRDLFWEENMSVCFIHKPIVSMFILYVSSW